jgi:phage repressor protein C with HTH and peptisase S24 domain
MDYERLLLTALKEKNIPVKTAIEMLEVSKGTFYNKIKASRPDPDFWTNVQNKLKISIPPYEDYTSNSIVSEPKQDYVEVEKGIPMYNSPGSASGVEIYTDPESTKVVGHLNFPGIIKGSFALQVYGNSMSPTLEDGSWAILRPIENKLSINWGQVYYIEYHDYRVFKRLLASENEDEVILWSDNQHEMINGRPKHSSVTINKTEIRRLSLVTDIYKKSNH